MFGGEFVGEFEHPWTIKRHTGFQREVAAQHGAHADRVAVVVGHAEVEHRAAGRSGFDRMAQGGHLMADGFDHDVRPVGRRRGG